MKRGYKETEIGEIPEEWEVTNLGSLCEVITKGTTPTTMGFSYQIDGINFVKVESITEHGEFLPVFFAHIDDKCHEAFKRSQLHEKDVLFSIAGAIGRTAIVPKWILPANTNQALAIIRLKKNSQVYPEYIVKTLSSPTIIDQSSMLKGGAAQLNMSLAQVQGLTIPLPPLPEQKKIAEVLSSVDESIRATQAVIEQAKVLKQGMLNKLLTKGIGHKKFKQTEIGDIPVEWNVVKIGDVSHKISNMVNIDLKTTYQELGIRSHCKGLFYKEPVSGLALGNKRVFWVKENCLIVNIVFAWEKAIAITTDQEKGFIVSHRFPMFEPDIELLCLDYFWRVFHINYGHSILKESSPGGAGRNRTLNQDLFLQGKIALPPIQEQIKIALILSNIDKVINQNAVQLAQQKKIKSGLMQDLLSGKKRVKV